jgi:hypothetical protein
LFSCKKENTTNDTKIISTELDGFDSIQTKTFVSDAHTTSGTVSIYQKEGSPDTLAYVFRNFKTDDGPNLDVWLSQTRPIGVNYFNLGDLKSINGDFYYKIADDGIITSYPYLTIWCSDFNVSFGYVTFDL